MPSIFWINLGLFILNVLGTAMYARDRWYMSATIMGYAMVFNLFACTILLGVVK